MSGDHNMNQTTAGWRKRQIALDKKAKNARELGLNYEPNKTVIEMAQTTLLRMNTVDNESVFWTATDEELEAFAKLVREDERGRMCEQCKECLDEKSTSNEANRPAFLGKGGQAK